MTSEREQLVKAVVDAWVVRGPSPRLHHQAMERLFRQWPSLANAVRNLALYELSDKVSEPTVTEDSSE